MTALETLEKLLPSYNDYYDVTMENVLSPYKAEAKFISHMEQYFLVKSAKLSDIDSTEHIYFAAEKELNFEQLSEMCQKAWEDGLKSVTPYYGHRNSDVTVIVFCDNIGDDLLKRVRKISYSKTYKFMLHGWSNFKLVVADVTSGKVVSNHYGAENKTYIAKFVKKICLGQK